MKFEDFKKEFGNRYQKPPKSPEVIARIAAGRLAGGREWDPYCPECGSDDTFNYDGPRCLECRAESPEYKANYNTYGWEDSDAWADPVIAPADPYLGPDDKHYRRR